MSDTLAISITGLTKAYRIWATPAQRLLSPAYAGLASGLPGGLGRTMDRRARAGYQDFFALQGVDFEVKKGEAVGIIGRNGSGKSTLLQLIAGTLQPTAGTVQVNGRIAALLELGAGFNPEFTGRENVYLNGAVLGFSRAQIDARFNDIATFADIGDFIEQPVKTYSSGMMVRLAFAVQTAVEPDILIVDEALAVGDAAFVAKCINWVANFIRQGGTLLFVSHDTGLVKQLTSRCVYLDRGNMICFEQTPAAVAAYEAKLANKQLAMPADTDTYAAPDTPYRITGVSTGGDTGMLDLPLRSDLALDVLLEVGVHAAGTLVFSIYNYLGLIVVSQTFELPAAAAGARRLKVRLEFTRLRLAPGSYRVNFSVRSGPNILSWKRNALNFVVRGSETETYIYREDAVARLTFD